MVEYLYYGMLCSYYVLWVSFISFYKFWPEALLQDPAKWEKQVEYLHHNFECENKYAGAE